ncbi:MAG: hypothetical protein K2L73_03630, partial [Muribaculaceae bacterium]|nr:hypothetical protein [Muribaculaceae bacterium]
NWAISAGFIILPIIIAPLLSSRILPLLPIIFVGIITILDRRNRLQPSPICFRIPHMAQVILVLSAIVMVVAAIYKAHAHVHIFTGQPIGNPDKLLPVLEISPIIIIVGLYNMLGINNPRSCRNCRNKLGEAVDRGVIGTLYTREAKTQIKFLFWSGLVIALATWIYFLFFYVTVNLNRKDTYFFTLCPLLWYVLSLIYFGVRYYTLWVYYCQNNATAKVIERKGTTIRYLVLCEDKILLHIPQISSDVIFSDDMKIDVPLRISLSFKEDVSSHEAHNYFVNASDMRDSETRLIFKSCDPGMYNNMFHYVAFVKDFEKASENLKGQWFTLAETNEMIREGMAATALAAELSRIYTVTMAWKAYDKSGNRLYEIKHYKPTFRLRDMQSWNVDYNDTNWLYVARVNEDKPFFKLRRFWNKMTKGIGK